MRGYAYFNDLTSGAPVGISNVPVTVQLVRGNGEGGPSATPKTVFMVTAHLLPYTTTVMKVTYPLDFTDGTNTYHFKDFSAGAGGVMPLDWPWTVNGATATSPTYTYTTSRTITAHYEQVPLPDVNLNPLIPANYYWKARDLDKFDDLTDKKPLPFVSSSIADAYNPGTPRNLAVNLQSKIVLNYFAPGGVFFGSYQIPVTPGAVGPDLYVNGTFALNEDAVRIIELNNPLFSFNYISRCVLYKNRSCFGTTVGTINWFAPDFFHEDSAIGKWTIEATYVRSDVFGITRTSKLVSLTYDVKWSIQMQP